MKFCTSCVMPETAETLTFDEEGSCSVCKQIEYKYLNIDWDERDQYFDTILEEVRGKYDYDCIVPFSGGKDSTYILWYLVRVKKLKPLVVRFDHGFLRPQVQENSLRTFRILGVDAIHFTPNWQIIRKLMFESLRRRGDFCWHCHTGIYSYPMWVALRYDVPLVVWGENVGEYTSFYEYEKDGLVDERFFNRVVNLGINAEDMVGMLDDTLSDYPVTERDLKPFTYPSLSEIREKKIRSVPLGNYINWDTKKHVEIIKRELGWKGALVEGVPPEYDYEKIECFMQGVRDYIKYLKRGFGRTTHLASIDIRNKRISRKDAVKMVAAHDGKRPWALDPFLKLLGVDEATFLKLVEPHVVLPHEMPPQEELERNRDPEPFDDLKAWRPVTHELEEDPP